MIKMDWLKNVNYEKFASKCGQLWKLNDFYKLKLITIIRILKIIMLALQII